MTKRQKYRVLVGINYPPNDKRAEPGEVVDDIPPSSIRWLLQDGIIEEFVAGQNTPADLAAAQGEPTEAFAAIEALAEAKGGD